MQVRPKNLPVNEKNGLYEKWRFTFAKLVYYEIEQYEVRSKKWDIKKVKGIKMINLETIKRYSYEDKRAGKTFSKHLRVVSNNTVSVLREKNI